jgi:hypothetical protein
MMSRSCGFWMLWRIKGELFSVAVRWNWSLDKFEYRFLCGVRADTVCFCFDGGLISGKDDKSHSNSLKMFKMVMWKKIDEIGVS